MAPKTLLVFCDGTGKDGTLAPGPKLLGVLDNSLAVLDGDDNSKNKTATNVLRLARSVQSHDASGNRQIVFYQSGVGSEATFTGDPVTGTTALQALGTAVASKIRDAYVFIAQNFEAGDEICLFGFSRGAYTARKLSGLIDKIGLLTRKNLGLFFEIWLQLIKKETPQIPSDTRSTYIKCVGVWDTVGSVYKEIDALNIADTSLPVSVRVALHAVSIQENRKKFLPTLWTPPSGGLAYGQILKQVWFPGAHSDVGGGYERHELADISLFWMAGEIKFMNLINLDYDFLRSYSQTAPNPWGTSQPHNAYEESGAATKILVGHKTRLESNQITTQTIFHESTQYSPQQLTDPSYMITMSIITQRFGGGFTPQYPSLNEFEQYCKDNWGTGLGASPPQSDDPGLVIPPTTVYWTSEDVFEFTSSSGNITTGGTDIDTGLPIYVARADYMGGIHPGMVIGDTMWIAYDDDVVKITDDIEGLVGVASTVRWASAKEVFTLDQLGGATPVPGGMDVDGQPFYVVRVASPIFVCGKVKVGSYPSMVFQGDPMSAAVYQVLVYV